MSETPEQWRRGDNAPAGAPVTNGQALRVLGFLMVYAAVVPPIAVILWRAATGAW